MASPYDAMLDDATAAIDEAQSPNKLKTFEKGADALLQLLRALAREDDDDSKKSES